MSYEELGSGSRPWPEILLPFEAGGSTTDHDTGQLPPKANGYDTMAGNQSVEPMSDTEVAELGAAASARRLGLPEPGEGASTLEQLAQEAATQRGRVLATGHLDERISNARNAQLPTSEELAERMGKVGPDISARDTLPGRLHTGVAGSLDDALRAVDGVKGVLEGAATRLSSLPTGVGVRGSFYREHRKGVWTTVAVAATAGVIAVGGAVWPEGDRSAVGGPVREYGELKNSDVSRVEACPTSGPGVRVLKHPERTVLTGVGPNGREVTVSVDMQVFDGITGCGNEVIPNEPLAGGPVAGPIPKN